MSIMRLMRTARSLSASLPSSSLPLLSSSRSSFPSPFSPPSSSFPSSSPPCPFPFPFQRGHTTSSSIPEETLQLVEKYRHLPEHPLSIRYLIETSARREGKEGREEGREGQELIESARFLQKELPCRLSRRIKEMQGLPFIVGSNPYVRTVYQLYVTSFQELAGFRPISSLEDEAAFTRLLTRLVENHKDVIPTLSKGMLECKKFLSTAEMNRFFDQKIKARIGIRVLAEQHISLHTKNLGGRAGIIDLELNPAKLAQGIASSCQVSFLLFTFFPFFPPSSLFPLFSLSPLSPPPPPLPLIISIVNSIMKKELCETNYGIAPEVVFDGATEITFPYISVHMEYIIFELLKNAMRATVEYNDQRSPISNQSQTPPNRTLI